MHFILEEGCVGGCGTAIEPLVSNYGQTDLCYAPVLCRAVGRAPCKCRANCPTHNYSGRVGNKLLSNVIYC